MTAHLRNYVAVKNKLWKLQSNFNQYWSQLKQLLSFVPEINTQLLSNSVLVALISKFNFIQGNKLAEVGLPEVGCLHEVRQ